MKKIKSNEIKKFTLKLGADLCGIADAGSFGNAPSGTSPKDILPEASSVIVFAKKFLNSTVKAKSSISYTIIRNYLSKQLDKISIELSYFLEKNGYIGLPTGAIEPCNWDSKNKRVRGLLSLKHAAEIAGLGRIGKNTLLINEHFGNMIWLGAVISNAELEYDEPIKGQYCQENCTICIDSCPINALSTPLMNQEACWNYAFGEENGGEWRIKCYKCRILCPYTNGIIKKV